MLLATALRRVAWIASQLSCSDHLPAVDYPGVPVTSPTPVIKSVATDKRPQAGMVLQYSTSQLLQLNNFSAPPFISAIKTLGLLRRPRYIHRASRRKFVYSSPDRSTLSVPSLWSTERTAATPAQLCAISPSILLLGDFNIHVDSSDSTTSTELLDIFNYFNITQHVDFPTHKKGHTLDLVCTSGQLERLAKKTGLTVHLDAFKLHQQQYKDALNTARSSHYSSIIKSGSNNPKTLFSTINKLLKPMDTISTSFTTSKCYSFLSFFNDKITAIHNQLAAPTTPPSPQHDTLLLPSHSLSSFSSITEMDLSSILSSMKTSTCALDPLPSSLVKACLPTLSPLITNIINSSLSSGLIPPTLKIAAVTPVLKKPGLDPDIPNNYRPISNLPYLSKVIERAVASQLKSHLNLHNLYEPFQSGFRSKHSTETALLKITNDILLSADSGFLSILILLDLSAAFDTINHSILLSRLQYSLGITGTALSWFTSYLSDRQQFIAINNCKSSTSPVTHGVPQGSVLGPLLFIIYILPLGQIIRRHGLNFHCYADDTQLYFSTKTITSVTHSTLTTCLTDIKSWMQQNFLKLNCNKSEILIIGPNSLTRSAQPFSLNIDGSIVTPSTQARNLGIILDPTLSFLPHANHITKTAFFHLRNIARLRPSLSSATTEILIHALITSRLDYCNSILYGSPNKILNKLQYVQNSAARLLTSTRRYKHITPVLHDLHWLPVKYRIDFKILLTTYKALNNLAPPYTISSLATIGGHDTKRVTWNILASMFNDDVGKRMNWKGINGKKSFSQMESKTLLLHPGQWATAALPSNRCAPTSVGTRGVVRQG
ncbi:uncharacterized protein LOC142933414 [Anarhichas minor]|uniref:uncharacterized protein LOC142933414 n=1 Tax=Anarhichas minor TaxID=65739 RepID=UPI003F73B217